MTWDDEDLLRKNPALERILISSGDIQRRVRQLANEISRDYAGSTPILVNVLKGAFVFLADLTRGITIPHEVDFMAISSYHGGTQSSGAVKIEKDLKTNITGRDVLIVEDIVDTGLTINSLIDLLATRSPRSLRVCTLLDKAAARRKEVTVSYTGFEIPSEFVIGYGLDYDEKYRGLPFIGVMKG